MIFTILVFIEILKKKNFKIIEDTKEAINRTTDNLSAKRKKTKWQTLIVNKTLHQKLKTEQHKPHNIRRVSSGVPLVIPAAQTPQHTASELRCSTSDSRNTNPTTYRE